MLQGNKIVFAYIQNDIKLLDLYNFITTALSKFAAIFQLEDQDFFPHLFNCPDMWDYSSIPSEDQHTT